MFDQSTIDEAASLYSKGIKGGWNKVAEELTAKGHKPWHGTYIHGQAICSEVLADPRYAHLRKNRRFGTGARDLIEKAILNSGYTQADADAILKNIP